MSLEHYEKCRFGILTESGITCGAGASEYYLETVSEDINMCVGCNQYFSCIDSENVPFESDSEEIDYE